MLGRHSPKHEVKRALLLDVVVGKSAAILELLAGKDQTLLVRWDALLVWTGSISFYARIHQP